MAAATTLFDLFGDFTGDWPLGVVQRMLGILGPGSQDPDLQVWLGALNNGTTVRDARVGHDGARASVEARLHFDNALAGYAGVPDAFPFALASMPDVEFRIQTLTAASAFVHLFASVSDGGVEVVLEGLPVEIRFPTGLIAPHPHRSRSAPGPEAEVGAFVAGEHDSLRIVYRRDAPTSVFVHVRLHVTEDFRITIRPSVPITFGACLFSEMPCLALHDVGFIPTPENAQETVDWLRHPVTPWRPEFVAPITGLFTIRSISIDSTQPPFKDLADALNQSSTREPDAEFVLDDLVVPFLSPTIVPLPRHLTIGIRRRVINANDQREVFQFERAPVQVFLGRDDAWGFLVESLFYRSLPSEDLSEDLGVTFKAAVFFGKEESAQHAFEVSLGPHFTPTLGYRRDFSSSTGMPEPGTGAAQTINALLHWEIVDIRIDIMAFRAGYSLGLALGEEDKGFGDCFEFTADLFVSMPPSGGDDSLVFKMRALDGQKVAFAIEGLGWRQGGFHFEGLAIPDGVSIYFLGLKLLIFEVGLSAEDGASYLSFTAGVVLPSIKGVTGSLIVHRLRFRVAGNPDAPFLKLDGFVLSLRFGSTAEITAGGFFSERRSDDVTIRELGLTGTVAFTLASVKYLFAIDVLSGSLSSPSQSFDYLMASVAFRGPLVIGWFELRGVRGLFARNMQPRLLPDDSASHELRYYKWYRDNTHAVELPENRRLTSWEPRQDAWAMGVGASASLAALGKLVELSTFVLIVDRDDGNGVLVVAEVLFAKSPRPIGVAVVQYDGQTDRVSILLGIDLAPSNFLDQVPAWVDRIGRLTGTLFITNSPATVAIGKLADTRTWLSAIFDIDLWVETFIQFGFCFEYVAGADGAKGVGLMVRLEGGINARIVRVKYSAGFSLMVLAFSTGSSDYAAIIAIDASLRIVLFKFLKFGVHVLAEFRTVGARPSRGEMRVQIRLETPWFLPDVTWTFEITFGDLLPEALGTAVGPVRTAAAVEEAGQRILPIHVERVDRGWNGEGVAPTWSIRQLRTMGSDEASRLARFAANTAIAPISTTSRLAIEFSVPVNDLLALDNNAAPHLGEQQAGDLTLHYELVGMAIRRRERFGVNRTWRSLDERTELGADFSDPSGVGLSGSFEPAQLTAFWDPAVQVDGRTATKKLLLNARTPFEFQTANGEIDETIVQQNPSWPCCNPKDEDRQPRLHEIVFRAEPAGADVAGDRRFSNSRSRGRFVQPAYAWPQTISQIVPSQAVVAVVRPAVPGVVFSADLTEDAAFCLIRLLWARSPLTLELLALDDDGEVAGRLAINAAPDFQNLVLPTRRPARRIELRVMGRERVGTPAVFATAPGRPTLMVDRVAYIDLRSYLDHLVGLEQCDHSSPEFGDRYAGRGALPFLPNHEYEIALTTRVTVAHPSKPPESVEVREYAYFRTKGLPGLNAVNAVGEEIAAVVASTYAGGRGVLYREEPVAVAFTEDFHVVLPLALRPAGTSEERTRLMRLALVVRPDTAPSLDTPLTTTAPDWIVAHRGTVHDDPPGPWGPIVSSGFVLGIRALSRNPFRARLAELTQRPGAACTVADPRQVGGTVLVAPPQGVVDPQHPGPELWPGRLPFQAIVQVADAGYVGRDRFDALDLSALTLTVDVGIGDRAAWQVTDGRLTVDGDATRRFAIFGDSTWNHLTVRVVIAPGATRAGLGVGLPAGNVPDRGLFAVVDTEGPTRRLVIVRRTSGTRFVEEMQAPLPADGGEPTTLIITAFDDRLRAEVGDVRIEVPRDEQREGRFCLIAQGPATFQALHVAGLPMLTFPFQPSRYRSFDDHIQSGDGRVRSCGANALGPGTTTGTTATLLANAETAIGPVMQADRDAGDRQRVFDRWVATLGLPLTDDVTELTLTRFEQAGRIELLLIESPEPLDFVSDVTLSVSRRSFGPTPPFPPPFGGGHGGVIDGGLLTGRPTLVARPERRREARRAALQAVGTLAGGGAVLTSTRPGREDSAAIPDVIASPLPFTPVPTTVLQDGTGRRAIVVPVQGGAAQPFAPGAYRLMFSLSRQRWATTDPADATNRYDATSVLTVTL